MKTLIVALLLGLSLAGEPTAGAATLAAIIPTVDRASACRLIYEKEAEFEAWFVERCDRPKVLPGMACTQGGHNVAFGAAVEVLDATPVFEARFGSMVAACPAEQEEQALRSEDKAAKRRAAAVMRKLKGCLGGCGKDEACRSGCQMPPPEGYGSGVGGVGGVGFGACGRGRARGVLHVRGNTTGLHAVPPGAASATSRPPSAGSIVPRSTPRSTVLAKRAARRQSVLRRRASSRRPAGLGRSRSRGRNRVSLSTIPCIATTSATSRCFTATPPRSRAGVPLSRSKATPRFPRPQVSAPSPVRGRKMQPPLGSHESTVQGSPSSQVSG